MNSRYCHVMLLGCSTVSVTSVMLVTHLIMHVHGTGVIDGGDYEEEKVDSDVRKFIPCGAERGRSVTVMV